jgi:hypothetical protein
MTSIRELISLTKFRLVHVTRLCGSKLQNTVKATNILPGQFGEDVKRNCTEILVPTPTYYQQSAVGATLLCSYRTGRAAFEPTGGRVYFSIYECWCMIVFSW